MNDGVTRGLEVEGDECRGDCEGCCCADDEGDVVADVADWGMEGYGIVVVFDEVVNHGFHGVVVDVGGVFGEASNDEAFEAAEDAAEAELVDDTFDFVDGFGDVFDEEDCGWVDDVEGCRDEVGDDGEVSAEEGACCGPGGVESVGGPVVADGLAGEDVEEGA